MNLEAQRYGRNKDTIVNSAYINSGSYRNKFNHITHNKRINRILYILSKKMLFHRSGTLLEDMYWISGTTGKILANVTDADEEQKIVYSDNVLKSILNRRNIITLHTHPSSFPPSIADFNSAFEHSYRMGLVICHDGTISAYTANVSIEYRLYLLYIEKYLRTGYSEYNAQIKTLNQLKENYDIDYWEVNSYVRKY